MIGISKENHTTHHRASSANTCPYRIGSSNRDYFHRLGNGKKTKYNKNNRNNARKDPGKTIAIFKSNRKANLKKAS